MMRHARLALLVALVVLGRSASAGEQLSIDDLVKQSKAVAIVDVTLAQGKQPDRARIAQWLTAEPPSSTSIDADAWLGICMPSRRILQQWLDGHPRHPGRATWQAVLRDGHARQLVFLRHDGATWKPTCETEVMLGGGYSIHPDFDKNRARVVALTATTTPSTTMTTSSATSTSAPTSPPTSPPAAAVVPTTTTSAPSSPVPASTDGGGCW